VGNWDSRSGGFVAKNRGRDVTTLSADCDSPRRVGSDRARLRSVTKESTTTIISVSTRYTVEIQRGVQATLTKQERLVVFRGIAHRVVACKECN
jgi:hypothetical protein